MLESYEDIRSKIPEKPHWYDENGVPRYAKFHPDLCPDIYADEVILLEIACQDCSKRFLVEMSWSPHARIFERHTESYSTRLRHWLKGEKSGWCPIHYGDPPIHDCVGDTMNCYDLRIVEFWRCPRFNWNRNNKLEIELEEIN